MRRILLLAFLLAAVNRISAEVLVRVGDAAPGVSESRSGSVVVIADDPGFRNSVKLQGWTVVLLSAAEAVQLGYIGSTADAPVLVFTDAKSKIRRIAAGADAPRTLSLLHDGKQTFHFACVRCHGVDGENDSYLSIRKLGGIGTRLTLEQIRARIYPLPIGSAGFSVRGHVLTREQLDALIAYIAIL
jgi:mono/diheme cytochrome c family protein